MATRLVKRVRVKTQDAATDALERAQENNPARRSQPVSFAHGLSVLMAEQKRVNRSRLHRLRRAWAIAVDEISGLSGRALNAEVRSIAKTGEVQVTVGNPSLAHEIGVVFKSEILRHLRELLTGKDSIAGLKVNLKRGGRRR
ncbi:hypothetical protein OAU50_07715 [Planctomycetota bacterium]|nr:hypothetical protein [Planctomycetota bacterium]